ncbi:MAG TPA: hypothetical protein VMV38_00835 [Candidatus Paceibacterota bacterium]|nr:hypothetical protein [Candidatus Paceibacterota bacterium]
MKEYLLIISGLIVVLIGALWITATQVNQTPSALHTCTQEAKLCPDGSSVGRTGPACEFPACPAATATTTSDGGPYTSGVRGMISLGPTCPVERIPPDPSCADKGYKTAVTIYREGSSIPFIIGNSDTAGSFSFALPPGSYLLQAASGKTFPRCASVRVVVPPNGYATTTISCDTGIR